MSCLMLHCSRFSHLKVSLPTIRSQAVSSNDAQLSAMSIYVCVSLFLLIEKQKCFRTSNYTSKNLNCFFFLHKTGQNWLNEILIIISSARCIADIVKLYHETQPRIKMIGVNSFKICNIL